MSIMLAEEYQVGSETPAREAGDGVGESLPVYLHEIGRVPLLTGAAEVELAMAYEAGLAATERLTSADGLSADEIARLEADVANGREARRRLIEANLRLVVSVARRYMNRGMALGDLIQSTPSTILCSKPAVPSLSHTEPESRDWVGKMPSSESP